MQLFASLSFFPLEKQDSNISPYAQNNHRIIIYLSLGVPSEGECPVKDADRHIL